MAQPAPPTQPPSDSPPVTPQFRRRGKGRPFVKGQSGNPGGKGRKRASKTLTMMAREASPKALRTLIKVMDDERAPHGVRCTAAAHILDRAWGRAPQQNTLTINHNMRIAQLTDEQLIAIIGGAAPDLVLGGSAVNTPLIEAEASEG